MKKFIITLAIIILGSCSFAQDYQIFKLDNGQTVIIKEVKENPIVVIDTWIKTGSIDETEKNNGVAHFLEHMFFKGTTKYPTGEFDKILESKGANTNAATSKDFTHYYITIPSKDFDTALEMHADMLLNPVLPRNELEKERKVVLEEISKNKDNPQNILYQGLIAQLYKTHPYKREVIGTNKVVETITREEMLDFYKTHYTPANMTTIIVGDVDAQTTLEKVKKYFNAPAQKNKICEYAKEKQITEPSTAIFIKDGIESAYMLIGFRGVEAKNKKENYALDVLATILGDGATSRLYKSVKDQKRLAQNIAAMNSTNRDDGLFLIQATFQPDNMVKLERAISEEIKNIQKNPPTKEEMQKAFKIIERDTYYSRESITNIAEEMGYIKTVFGDINVYDNYIQDLEKLSPQDIQAAAKKYLDTNKMAISYLLPGSYEKKEPSLIPINQIKKPSSTLISEDNSIKKYGLENGATVILNQNNSNDIIAVKIYFKGGKLLEKKAGISSLVAEIMQKGTKKYTKNEFAQILEEKGIKLNISSALETFEISLKTTKNELSSAIDLLNEALNNALFDKYEIENLKTDTLLAIKSNRDKPFNNAIEEFKELIYQNSPYAKSTSKKIEKSIPTINREDLIDYYSTIFNPKNAIISVNGSLSEEQKNKLFDFFATSLNSNNPAIFNFDTYKNSFPELAHNNQKIIKKDTQTAWIVLGWPTCGLSNEKDYITLQVINSIMGTGMSSRLFEHLRDQQGLAYQVGSAFSANMNKGFFLTYIGTSPQKAQHSKNEILKEINLLKTEFVTQNELQAAKDKLIGNFILNQETNSEKASSIGWFETTNRGYAFNKKYPKLIQKISSNDIITVANKYFSKPYVLTIVEPSK